MNKEEFGLCIRKSRAKEVTLIKLNSDLSLSLLPVIALPHQKQENIFLIY